MMSEIEINILKLFSEAFGANNPALGYTIEKIDSYKAELSNFGTLIRNKRSAALVASGGLRFKRHFAESTEFEVSVLVYLYNRNAKLNERSTRFGCKGEVGLYQMIEDVLDLLNNNTLGLLSQPLQLGEATPIFDNKVDNFNAAVWELDFRGVVTISRERKAEYDKLALLQTIATGWSVSDWKTETLVKFNHESEE